MTEVCTAYGSRLIPTLLDSSVTFPTSCRPSWSNANNLAHLNFVEPEFVVVGSAPGFAVAGLEPGFEVAGFVEPAVPGALPGSVPHGGPLGAVPGLFVVFGFTV